MGEHVWWILSACWAVAAVLLLVGLHRERRLRLLRDLPTSRPGGVFIGLVEVVGAIRCAAPHAAFLSGRPCLHSRWTVEERWSRSVPQAKGGSKRESGWKTVASGGEETPFELVDATGAVRISPAGAQVDGVVALDRECGPEDPLYHGKGPQQAIPDSDRRRRFRETILPPEGSCFVVGQARQRQDVVGAEIAFDRDAPLFVIAPAGERSVARGLFWGALLWKLAGLALAVLAPVCALSGDAGRWPTVSGAIAGFLGCWSVGWFWLAYNSLVELRQRVRQGWANVDVQLKRRFDLITRLVPIVEACAGHEQQAQQTVAAMRTQLRSTPPGEPGPDLALVAPRMIALVEAYPSLIAQGGFSDLQRTLADCEGRIALARNYFNDIAANWNTRLERIPDVLVARLAGMERRPLIHELAPVA